MKKNFYSFCMLIIICNLVGCYNIEKQDKYIKSDLFEIVNNIEEDDCYYKKTIIDDCYVIKDFYIYDDCFVPLKFKETTFQVDNDCTLNKIEIQKDKTYDYNGLLIYLSNNSCYSYLEKTKYYLSLIPQNMFNVLKNNNWTITITTDNIAKTHYQGIYSSIMGVTIYNEKTIYVEDRNNAIKGAIIHECAHAYDKEMNFISSNQEWINVLNKDTLGFEILTNGYTHWKTDNSEAWAEAVQLCYQDQKIFQKHCPNMYAYIRGIIEQ